MKNKLRRFIIPFTFFITLACASAALAQTDEPVTGGFGKAEVTAKDVRAAARYAVRQQSKTQRTTIKLISVERAAQQVVAGLNYRLCLTVESRIDGKKTRRTVEALVYKDLRQKLSLTSFTEMPDSCPDR